MMTRLFWVAVAGLLLATAAPGVEPRELVGKYRCTGVMPDGSKFDHPVEITLVKGKTLLIYYDSDGPDIGLCALEGKKLTVRFQGVKDPKNTGEAEYTLKKDGVLEGRWRYKGEKWMPETLTPKKK